MALLRCVKGGCSGAAWCSCWRSPHWCSRRARAPWEAAEVEHLPGARRLDLLRLHRGKVQHPLPDRVPSFFEEGVHQRLRQRPLEQQVGKGIRLVNDACPGETSNGLIGENELIGGETSTETIAEVEAPGGLPGPGRLPPLQIHYVNHLPLHNSLRRSLAAGRGAERRSGRPRSTRCKAITLNIGSNDELAAITQCKDEVAHEFETEGKSKFGRSPDDRVHRLHQEDRGEETVPRIIKNLDQDDRRDRQHGTGRRPLHRPDHPARLLQPELVRAAREATGSERTSTRRCRPTYPELPERDIREPVPDIQQGRRERTRRKEQKSICKYTEMCNPNVQRRRQRPARTATSTRRRSVTRRREAHQQSVRSQQSLVASVSNSRQ